MFGWGVSGCAGLHFRDVFRKAFLRDESVDDSEEIHVLCHGLSGFCWCVAVLFFSGFGARQDGAKKTILAPRSFAMPRSICGDCPALSWSSGLVYLSGCLLRRPGFTVAMPSAWGKHTGPAGASILRLR